jgi:hypothetical protein
MLRIRADHLRITLLTSLGLLPLACGAKVEPTHVAGIDGALHTSSQPSNTEPSPPAPSNEPSVTPPGTCEGSPLLVGDVNTGLVTCASGVVHRPVAVECPNRLSEQANPNVYACDGCGQMNGCQAHADCTAKPYGHCESRGQLPNLACEFGCVTDADCNADEACVCGPFIGECIKANCRSAEDCGGGYLCAQFRDLFGIGCGEPMQLACQTPEDDCRSSQDCGGAEGHGANCSAADGTWRCAEVPGIACGRPFLVDGQARLAQVAARGDYAALLAPRLDGLDAGARDRLTRAWLDIGRMEHASIAAFARFCLQLLELGAPHALLVSAQTSMADETEHARLAFALASHYAGAPLGPGALPMDGALRESRLEDVLRLVVREGCIGETVAALEAAEALAHTEDPVVGRVLERIARDERAHAELAWRFVAWALGERPELASVVEHELALGEQAHRSSKAEAPLARSGACVGAGFELLRHGILDDSGRASVRTAAWRDVVQPCARSLLAQS